MSYLKISDFILLEINEYSNKEVRNSRVNQIESLIELLD